MDTVVTPFGGATTAEEVAASVDLQATRVVVTGGASGIGTETARVLAGRGAEVTLAVRDVRIGDHVAETIRASTGNPRVFASHLDLADSASIDAFVGAWSGRLDILVNNAGVMALPSLELTARGWEMQLTTNFLGHFQLTRGLRAAMARSGGARVVSVSSSGHLFSPVVFDDLHFAFRPYDPIVAYGQSKTATALLSVALTDQWHDDGITSNSLNPGAIPTNLQRHTGGLRTPPERRKSVAQGAATSVLLAISPLLEGVGGRYFEDCNEAARVDRRSPDAVGVAQYAVDSEIADRLWSVATRLIS